MNHQWPPEVVRAMHQFADAAPVAPSLASVLEQDPIALSSQPPAADLVPDERFALMEAITVSRNKRTTETRNRRRPLMAIEPAQTQPDGRPRWPIIAVAAAAVVAIVVGALMLADRDDSAPPVPADTVAPDVPEATAADEEIAHGFLDAYVANDADQALSYITESAIVAAGMWGSMEEFLGDIAWNEATGSKTRINDCEPRGYEFEAGVTVRCGFDFHLFGADALGNDPFRDNYWDLTIRDGQIVAAKKVTPASNGWTAEWSSFQLWIKAEHRDDLPVLYDGQYFGSARLTEDAVQIWEQRTQEYAQTVLLRRESYPADIAAVCSTRAPQHRELTVLTDGALDQVATKYTAAAAVLEQTMKELGAVDAPRSTDMTDYVWFQHQLLRLVAIAEEAAAAATAGDSTRLAELNAEYHDFRQGMTGGARGSGLGPGLEECLASLQS